MHFYGFLKQEAKEIKHKDRGKDIIKTLPVTMDEELDLKLRSWRIENASSLKGLLEILWVSKKWSNESIPNRRLKLLIPASQTFQSHTVAIRSSPSHETSHSVANSRSRSNLTTHPMVLINGSSSSNLRIKSRVLMTPWKRKLRTLFKH